MPGRKIHGRGVKATGRQKSGDESEDDDEKRKEYFRIKKAQERGQTSTPKKKTDRYKTSAAASMASPSASSASRSRSRPGTSRGQSSSQSRSRGRPPQSGATPDTPTTRRRKNTESQRRSRHTAHVTKQRKKAANKRWNTGEESSAEVDSDVSLEDPAARRLFFGDENENVDGEDEDEDEDNEAMDLDVVTTSRSAAEPHGKMGQSSYYEHMKDVKAAFEKNVKNRQEGLDVTLELLTKSSHLLDLRKLELKVDNKTLEKNYSGFSNVTQRTIERKAKKIRDSLGVAASPKLCWKTPC